MKVVGLETCGAQQREHGIDIRQRHAHGKRRGEGLSNKAAAIFTLRREKSLKRE